MTSQESSPFTFGLPEEILRVLPTDPYDQLDVARKITSIALLTRVSDLESESSALRSEIAEKEALITDLRSRADSLGASLNLAAERLAADDVEKENLRKENELLSDTVLKLSRHVAKLEVFKRTLVQSLNDEEQSFGSHFSKTSEGVSQIIARPTPNEEDAALPPSRSSADEDAEEYYSEVPKSGLSSSILSMSATSTPQLSPPVSPPTLSSSASPSITPKLVISRRHPMSFTTSGGMFDDTSSVYSASSSHQDSFSGLETGSQTGRTRANGKDFLRQVRNRLSYEQFAAFLANIKELNSRRQTKEETLQKAAEIFSSDNMDLYETFQGLLTRKVQ